MTTISGGQSSSSASWCASNRRRRLRSITAFSVFDAPCPGLFPSSRLQQSSHCLRWLSSGQGGGLAGTRMDEWEPVAAVTTVFSGIPRISDWTAVFGGNSLVGVNVGILLFCKDEAPLWPSAPGGRSERRCAAAPQTWMSSAPPEPAAILPSALLSTESAH